jgi:hypothetical protein
MGTQKPLRLPDGLKFSHQQVPVAKALPRII